MSAKAAALRALQNAEAAQDEVAVQDILAYIRYLEETEAQIGRIREDPEPGILENITSGIGAGAVGIGEMSLLGAAAALEEEDELYARDLIQSVADSIRPEGGDPESISYKVSSAIGSILGLAAPAVGLGIAGAPTAGILTTAALASGAGRGEASERARAADATQEQRDVAVDKGTFIGLLEVAPVARFVRFVDIPVLTKLVDSLGPKTVETIGQRIRSAGTTGGVEAAQEAAANVLQNLTEQEYNAAAETFAGTAEEAALGGTAGAIIQGVVDLFIPKRRGAGTDILDDASKELGMTREELAERLEAENQTIGDVAEQEGVDVPTPTVTEAQADLFPEELEAARVEPKPGSPEFARLVRDREAATLEQEREAEREAERRKATESEDVATRIEQASPTIESPAQRDLLEEEAEVRAEDARLREEQVERQDLFPAELDEARRQGELFDPDERRAEEEAAKRVEEAEAQRRRATESEDVGPKVEDPRQQDLLDTQTQEEIKFSPAVQRARKRVAAKKKKAPKVTEATVTPVEQPPAIDTTAPDTAAPVEPTTTGRPLTKQDFDDMGFPKRAAVRKRLMGKDLDDKDVQDDLRKSVENIRQNRAQILDNVGKKVKGTFVAPAAPAVGELSIESFKRTPDFATTGEYEVTFNDKSTRKIFRDKDTQTWYDVDKVNSKEEGETGFLGFNRKEAEKKLIEDKKEDAPAAPADPTTPAKPQTSSEQVVQARETTDADRKRGFQLHPDIQAERTTKEELTSESDGLVDFIKKAKKKPRRTTKTIYSQPFLETLDYVAKNTKDPFEKQLAENIKRTAESMAQAGFRFDISVKETTNVPLRNERGSTNFRDPDNQGRYGSLIKIQLTRTKDPTAFMNGATYRTFLHEAVHATTVQSNRLKSRRGFPNQEAVVAELTKVNPEQMQAAGDLFNLFDNLSDHFDKRIAMYRDFVKSPRGFGFDSIRYAAANKVFAANNMAPLVPFEVQGYREYSNAFLDPDEILAWGLTDRDMQDFLNSIPVDRETGKVLTNVDYPKIAKGIKSVDRKTGRVRVGKVVSAYYYMVDKIRQLLGFPPETYTAFDELLRINESLLKPKEAYAAKLKEYQETGQLLEINKPLSEMSTPDDAKQVAEEVGKTQKTINKVSATNFKNEAEALLSGQGKLPEGAKKISLGILPSKALAEVAERYGIKSAMRLHEAILNQRGDLNIAEEGVRKILTPIGEWISKTKEKAPKIINTFNKLVYSSTLEKVDPSRPVSFYEELLKAEEAKQQRGEPADPDLYREKIKTWNSMQKDWKSLGKDGQKAYTDLRDMYKAQYDRLLKVLERRIDDSNIDAEGKASLKDEIFAKLLSEANIDPYFPLTRHGDYWLSYTRGGEFVVEAYETPGARVTAMKEYMDDPEIPNASIKDFRSPDQADFTNAPPSSFVGTTLRILQTNGVDGETQAQIMRLFIEALPESSFAKALQRRKETPGFREDAFLAATTKAYDLARQTERLKNSARIRKTMDEIKEEIGEKADSDTVNDILSELEQRASFAINPPKDGIAKQLNRAAFIYTIGFNTSASLVNLSQIPLFAIPMLSAKYGLGATNKAFADAYSIFGGSGFSKSFPTLEGGTKNQLSLASLDNYYTSERGPNDEIIFSVRQDKDLTDAQIKELENIKPVVELAASQAQLNTSFLADTMGLDESGRATTFLDKVASTSAIMFHQAELMNRQVTMVAAYNLELQKVKAQKGTITDADRKAAAIEALNQTQDVNGGSVLETAPRYAQKGIGRIALMYKTYGIQMYYIMLRTGKEMIDAHFAGNKELRNQAFKQLVGIHLSALFFAGVQGLPLYGAVSMIANLFLDEDEDDADTIVRKYIGEGWYKGVISEVTGLDVSQRVGLSNLVVQSNRFNNDPSPEETFMFYLGGPAWSVGSRFFKGAQELQDGDFERGVESMLPGAVRNAYRAIVRYPRDEGIRTRRGDPVYDDITTGELLGQLLGFAPTEYTYRQEINSNLKRIDSEANRTRTKLLRRYYVAKRFGDYDEAKKVRKEMIEFSKRHPGAKIDPDTINRSMAQHQESSITQHNGINISPYMQRALRQNRQEYSEGFF